ncbi:hypothetical protein L615_002900000470, partial [Nocardioides sp. J9]
MALRPVTRRSVADQVFDQVLDDVLDGELAVGEPLPRIAQTGLVEVR